MTSVTHVPDGGVMDLVDALDDLPPSYRQLLGLLGAGVAPADIAAELGVEEAGLPTLVELASAKLNARLAPPGPSLGSG